MTKRRKGSQLIPQGPRPRVPVTESALAAQLIGLTEDELFDRLSVEHLSTFVHQKLWRMGAGDNGVLRRGLKHPDARVRAVCATMLDHFLDDRAVDEVVACLDDPDARVRARALHTLGCDRCKEGSCRPGEAAFVPTAIRLAREDPDPSVRTTAIETLARSSARQSDSVLAVLGAASGQDPDLRVRKVAARWARQLAGNSAH